MGKYEEALERAKAGKPIDEVFPELKESEDERIRKWLVEYFKSVSKSWIHRDMSPEQVIAYLEKQKEQKPNVELIQKSWYLEGYHDGKYNIEPKWLIQTGKGGPRYEENPKYGTQKPAEWAALQKAFVNSKKDYTLEEKCDASDYADTILPTSVTYGENDEEYKLHKIIEAAFIAGKKMAQKPAEWMSQQNTRTRLSVKANTPEGKETYEKVATKMRQEISLDEAAYEYFLKTYGIDNIAISEDIKRAVKFGAEWMAEKGVTVEGVFRAGDPGYPDVRMGEQYSIEHILRKPDGIEPGDEVIVQIRKK